MLPHVAKSSVGVLIDNSAVWTKGQLPVPSTKVKLMRHLCRWKFNNRNSLSVPTRHSGGTTAVNWGTPVLTKEDRAVGRYLCKLS